MLISFTAKLIWVFVFAYAGCWFSHDAAQIQRFQISLYQQFTMQSGAFHNVSRHSITWELYLWPITSTVSYILFLSKQVGFLQNVNRKLKSVHQYSLICTFVCCTYCMSHVTRKPFFCTFKNTQRGWYNTSSSYIQTFMPFTSFWSSGGGLVHRRSTFGPIFYFIIIFFFLHFHLFCEPS